MHPLNDIHVSNLILFSLISEETIIVLSKYEKYDMLQIVFQPLHYHYQLSYTSGPALQVAIGGIFVSKSGSLQGTEYQMLNN